MFRSFASIFVPAITVTLLITSSGNVYGQTAQEKAGARAAAEAGADAFDAGRFEEAIELFRRAENVVHATPHLLYIARAQVKLNRWVEARETYLAILNDPLPRRPNQVVLDTRANAERELDALEPRLPQITVVVQGSKADDVRVFMDDHEIPTALVGIPRPVDPGTHEFHAVATGSESSRTAITIKEGGQETVMLTLRPTTPSAQPASEPTHSVAVDSSQPDDGQGFRKIAAYSALGIGAVGAGLGTLFLVQSLDARKKGDDLYQSCSPTCLPQREEIEALDDKATSKRTLSFVGFGVGVAGIATGITLLLLDGGSKEAPPNTARIEPWFGLGSVGVTGTF